MRQRPSAFRLLPLVLVSAALSGCIIVPVKMRTIDQTAAGKRTPEPAADIVPGTTTREQFEQQFHDIAVDSGDPNLFFGQYRKSGWAVVYGFGGLGAATAGGGRVWCEFDILATFDDSGHVKTFDRVVERKFAARLTELQQQGLLSQLDFDSPVTITGRQILLRDLSVKIELLRDRMNVEVDRPKKKHKSQPPMTASYSAGEVKKLGIDTYGGIQPGFRARPFTAQIKFTAKSAIGSAVSMYLEPCDAILLMRWHTQQKSNPTSPSP